MPPKRRMPPIRNNHGIDMVSVNWLLPVDLWERLDAFARDDDRSMASLGRRILTDWVKAQGTHIDGEAGV